MRFSSPDIEHQCSTPLQAHRAERCLTPCTRCRRPLISVRLMECLYKKVSTINGVLHGQCLHNNSVGKQRNKGVALITNISNFACLIKDAYLRIDLCVFFSIVVSKSVRYICTPKHILYCLVLYLASGTRTRFVCKEFIINYWHATTHTVTVTIYL